MLIEFALASLVFIAVPRPDQALISGNALLRGRAAGMRTMLGGASGLTMHVTAAAVGASALLAASSTAYTTLKLVGSVYLLCRRRHNTYWADLVVVPISVATRVQFAVNSMARVGITTRDRDRGQASSAGRAVSRAGEMARPAQVNGSGASRIRRPEAVL